MRADQRKFHYIYKITRTDGSGKYYIGMHSTDDLEDGYFGSGILLWKSIKKHGKEKHVKEIIEYLSSRAELRAREREIVNEELLSDKKCMNLKPGGAGGTHGKERWQLGSEAEKRRRQGLSVALSRRLHGKSREWPSPGFSGKHHSEETKQKMCKPKNQGAANSQFGTCWVTKETSSIKIKKHLLEEYLALGYTPGRKMKTH